MASPKPIPTHLKLLNGNPGRRKINQNEPKPVGALRDNPDWLTDSQKEIWRYAIDNAPAGLLKKLDMSVLLVWVIASDTHQRAARQCATSGLIKMTRSGDEMQNPLVPVMNKQALLMLRAAAELGFTPSSRSRIEINGDPEEKQNPLNKYL